MTEFHVPAHLEWDALLNRARQAFPEAFTADGALYNLTGGNWKERGTPRRIFSAVDGRELGALPMLGPEQSLVAVEFASREARAWARVPLAERIEKVMACLNGLREHRDLMSHMLMWEIGKPWHLATSDVDRCISGVEWYVENIEPMLAGRTPIGLVSNIASWNYPMSALFHAVLVQVLAGNSAIAKTPTDGGLYCLTVASAIARAAGLPVSLVSGSGAVVSDALVRDDRVRCVSFVGGKSSGRHIAAALHDREKRYMLEMEGVNAWGLWDFSDWTGLAKHLKKSFDYGKQRCTAYPRYVIQRELFPQFLETYLSVVKGLKWGHPFAVENDSDPLPAFDYGPLINARKTDELNLLIREAIAAGGLALYKGDPAKGTYVPGQDTSAYMAPAALIDVPRNHALYHHEAFGPVDTFVAVDSVSELINEMNVSNGSLVATIGCDNPETASRIASELRGFKVGINVPRSRGDRDEVFGGLGQSWKGCYVGGKYLIEAVTVGEPGEQLYGNFNAYTRVPAKV